MLTDEVRYGGAEADHQGDINRQTGGPVSDDSHPAAASAGGEREVGASFRAHATTQRSRLPMQVRTETRAGLLP